MAEIEHTAENDAGIAGLGSLVTRLLAEHWPNSGVNGWYLADLLRDNGVRAHGSAVTAEGDAARTWPAVRNAMDCARG